LFVFEFHHACAWDGVVESGTPKIRLDSARSRVSQTWERISNPSLNFGSMEVQLASDRGRVIEHG